MQNKLPPCPESEPPLCPDDDDDNDDEDDPDKLAMLPAMPDEPLERPLLSEAKIAALPPSPFAGTK